MQYTVQGPKQTPPPPKKVHWGLSGNKQANCTGPMGLIGYSNLPKGLMCMHKQGVSWK